MLKQPFSGIELFCIFNFEMHRISEQDSREIWDTNTGKQKKQAWNNLAKRINDRMQMEVAEKS